MRDDLGIEMPLQALIELHLDHGFDLEGHTQTLAGVHEIVRLEEEVLGDAPKGPDWSNR